MIHGLWHSAAGMDAQQIRQNLLAANIANADTAGFKPDFVSLLERPVAVNDPETPGSPQLPHALLDRLSGGIAYAPTHTDFSAGPMVASQNPLDVAIEGDGFLTVRTPDGVRYTRNGRLSMRADGALVTATGGLEVLDEGGQTIQLDRAAKSEILIDEQGVVRQGNAIVGTLKVTSFADRRQLTKIGQNLYDGAAATTTTNASSMRQRAYEGSSVDPISSMVRMLEATRAYQLNATMISIQDETLSKAVNEVGRLA